MSIELCLELSAYYRIHFRCTSMQHIHRVPGGQNYEKLQLLAAINQSIKPQPIIHISSTHNTTHMTTHASMHQIEYCP